MRKAAAGAALAAGLLAVLLAGCAGEPAQKPAAVAPPALAAPVLAPLRPLDRLPPVAKSDAESTVVPVVSDGSTDPEEDGAVPGVEFERGGASWYGSRFHGRRTASGERFDQNDFTAAHRQLPFGSLVCIRNLANDRTVLVRVNDRGPSSRKRVIDISQAAAEELAMVGMGVQTVALSRPVPGRDRCE
ncbi:septal ring lytic transglycosylase RlpA family protein [Xylophilus rhododendri]|uniref:Endolytic peptidoglycan transglycosylase RlpA n=1 Tax=Xylophilus rhododendri TaxID=2697032 RepID=A0A857J9D6_9BURK|nr:septal ring lytic transglycosylase RlpA family protein [Xylophilus rhododendri]QHI99602.1 septal ring lytic transglycosylase RlpA family protein [Xylophilus rhododendri]